MKDPLAFLHRQGINIMLTINYGWDWIIRGFFFWYASLLLLVYLHSRNGMWRNPV